MHSFTQDLTCVTYLLLSETIHLLQVQPGRGGRREAFNIIGFPNDNTQLPGQPQSQEPGAKDDGYACMLACMHVLLLFAYTYVRKYI